MIFANRMTLLTAATILMLGPCAHAAEDLMILSDQSTAVTLPEVPSTVVLGNPSIADATVEGRLLFLHGKGFGVTNVMILNADGKRIAEYTVRVRVDDPEAVVVFKQSGRVTIRESYSCTPSCEPTLQVGDSPAYTASVVQNMTDRSKAVREQRAGSN